MTKLTDFYTHKAAIIEAKRKKIKRLTLSALFYGKRGKLVGAKVQLFCE